MMMTKTNNIARTPLPLTEVSGFAHGCTLVVCWLCVCNPDFALQFFQSIISLKGESWLFYVG